MSYTWWRRTAAAATQGTSLHRGALCLMPHASCHIFFFLIFKNYLPLREHLFQIRTQHFDTRCPHPPPSARAFPPPPCHVEAVARKGRRKMLIKEACCEDSLLRRYYTELPVFVCVYIYIDIVYYIYSRPQKRSFRSRSHRDRKDPCCTFVEVLLYIV
jgi:hypothetical protein